MIYIEHCAEPYLMLKDELLPACVCALIEQQHVDKHRRHRQRARLPESKSKGHQLKNRFIEFSPANPINDFYTFLEEFFSP